MAPLMLELGQGAPAFDRALRRRRKRTNEQYEPSCHARRYSWPDRRTPPLRAQGVKPRLTVISQWSAGSDGAAITALGKKFEEKGGTWQHSPVPGSQPR